MCMNWVSIYGQNHFLAFGVNGLLCAVQVNRHWDWRGAGRGTLSKIGEACDDRRSAMAGLAKEKTTRRWNPNRAYRDRAFAFYYHLDSPHSRYTCTTALYCCGMQWTVDGGGGVTTGEGSDGVTADRAQYGVERWSAFHYWINWGIVQNEMSTA